MADCISNYLRDSLNDHIHGGPAFTPPATTYFALMDVRPTASGGGHEISGGSYARVAVTNDTSNWPSSSAGVKQNGNAIDWGTLTNTAVTAVAVAEYDASTGGNLLFIYDLSTPTTVGGSQPFQIPANGLTQSWASDSSYSTYLRDNLNDLVHGATSWSAPATTYFTLMTVMSALDGTGGTEVSAADYGRVALTNNSTNWPASSGQLKQNAAVIDFTSGATNNWGTVVGSEERDASSGGNLLEQGVFSPSRAINIGVPFQFPVAAVMDSWTA